MNISMTLTLKLAKKAQLKKKKKKKKKGGNFIFDLYVKFCFN